MSGNEEETAGDSLRGEASQRPQTIAEALAEADEKPKSLLWLIMLLTGLFALGAKDYLLDLEPNGCAMTYMFEYPRYVPVRLKEDVAGRFPKYGLYVYGEGEDMVKVSTRGAFFFGSYTLVQYVDMIVLSCCLRSI